MAYYPLSQIKSNLYTKGNEYIVQATNLEYKGYYYQTSNGNLFTGKTPQDKPNNLLTPINPQPVNDFNDPKNIPTTKKSLFTIQEINYNSDVIKGKEPTLPLSIYPTLTEKDYKLGEFQRYFVSKVNEIKFIEVNEFTYNQYLNQDPNVSYQLYSPIQLPWELTGDREKVYEVNLKTVQRIENNLKLRGFTQYFKDRFDQFYKDASEESLGDSNTSY